jgi:hypothetical protein
LLTTERAPELTTLWEELSVARSVYEINKVLEQGTSIEVSARDYGVYSLIEFAELAYANDAKLTIKYSGEIGAYAVRSIAEKGKHKVILR